ncbi:hypothetical protein [Fischerella sp. PCC 9605]|uniref:hypothetical protein n=1 Tax=Fischerella sp. PCC 9605 TaxID=1173024 RepID=UPI0012DD5770|nr:hypothetical protein [Fischerella sp. PCC 9605]
MLTLWAIATLWQNDTLLEAATCPQTCCSRLHEWLLCIINLFSTQAIVTKEYCLSS